MNSKSLVSALSAVLAVMGLTACTGATTATKTVTVEVPTIVYTASPMPASTPSPSYLNPDPLPEGQIDSVLAHANSSERLAKYAKFQDQARVVLQAAEAGKLGPITRHEYNGTAITEGSQYTGQGTLLVNSTGRAADTPDPSNPYLMAFLYFKDGKFDSSQPVTVLSVKLDAASNGVWINSTGEPGEPPFAAQLLSPSGTTAQITCFHKYCRFNTDWDFATTVAKLDRLDDAVNSQLAKVVAKIKAMG